MNQHYMQQQQQPPLYGGQNRPTSYEGLNANMPPNMIKPPGTEQYPPQKPMQTPEINLPPRQNLYYNYNANMQENVSTLQNSSSHAPPIPTANLSNQMSNMSLNNVPPSQNIPPPTNNGMSLASNNINGYTSADHSPSNPADPLLTPPAAKQPPISSLPTSAPANNFNNYPTSEISAPPNQMINQRPPSGPPPSSGQGLQQPPMGFPSAGPPKGPGNAYLGQQMSQSGPQITSPNQQMPPLAQQMPPLNQQMPPPSQKMPPLNQPMPPLNQPMPPLNQPNTSIQNQQNLSGPTMQPGSSGSLTGRPLQQPGGPGSYNMYQPPGQQNLSGPLPPSSSYGPTGAVPPTPNQSLQRQAMPGQTMPPLPGQMPPRQPPGTMPGYQQPGVYPPNYQQDLYGAQKGQYHPQGLNMPGALTGGYQPGTQPQQAKRLDPDSMPSPIQVMQDDQKARGGIFATNQKGLVPPFVTSKFIVQDQGNASPRFIRSTIYTVPTTNDIMKQTGVPFGLILSPMAQISEGEQEPPIVDMGEVGPVRCTRCKAYMSPFMQFIDAGRRFQCMFCKASSEVPAEYFQHLDHTGQRMDRFERPELMLGTYEYLATKDYCRDNTFPKPPAIVFIIDVSYNNVKSGLVNLICAEMKNIIKNLPKDTYEERTKMKVGFITYSNTVHFYNVSPWLTQPQMMVVGDVQDVFMPLLDGFLCDVEESATVIDSLMSQIPVMFGDTRETELILAPAIQAGLEALKASNCAGKLLVFHSSLPSAEAPGKLKNRDDRKLLGTEKEKTVLAPQNNVYNNLGQECVGAGCSVDLFVFNNSYVDIATISQVCRLTGGEVYKYTYFQAETDGDRLITDIINNISRPIAFDAVMRVRTSTGVRPTDFFGHFFMSNTTDMELASIDCNKAVAVEIKHDDKLTDEDGVYIQVALLYTSCGGVRRLRINNLSLRASSQMTELYRACDPDAVINFFAKQSVFKLIESTPKNIKYNLISKCATILAAYRKHCASPFSASQLVLPECMKLLPLYVNCLLKSDAISGGADMTIDDRSYVMQAVATMPLYTSVVYFYPRLLPLHDVDPQDTELPQQLRCSFDKFADDGAYLLENGIHMFLWLGLALPTEWIQAVFGAPVVDTDRTSLPVLDNALNRRIRDIINRVRIERYHCMRLTFVRQRDKLEMVLRHFLVEDRENDGSPSYVDFLCHMHKEIKTLLNQ
ncbi:protein transport protein Sec24D [Chelonus insularis]|uniref:protein transport protein Sec24D n=1 Tax=Chelonus insularis TaxID=460826 RepID=UPI0015891692|nr:protein transport protein Sec24D [Chelonus insularis]